MARDIPMLLSGLMVRAFIEGRKTQTRRLSNRHNAKPGDRIWFKETFRIPPYSETNTPIYRASENDNKTERWTPSLFMPKAICRCWAEVVTVKTERLNEITHGDLLKEGLIPYEFGFSFQRLWNSLHDKKGERWSDNPTVFVFTFKKIKP